MKEEPIKLAKDGTELKAALEQRFREQGIEKLIDDQRKSVGLAREFFRRCGVSFVTVIPLKVEE